MRKFPSACTMAARSQWLGVALSLALLTGFAAAGRIHEFNEEVAANGASRNFGPGYRAGALQPPAKVEDVLGTKRTDLNVRLMVAS